MDLIVRAIGDHGWLTLRYLRRLSPMSTVPLELLMLIFAGWVNRSQQDVIAYLQEENRVLREQLRRLKRYCPGAQRAKCG